MSMRVLSEETYQSLMQMLSEWQATPTHKRAAGFVGTRSGGDARTRLKIFGKCARGGCYRAYIWKPPTTPSPINFGSAVVTSEADLGVLGDEVIAVNHAEIAEVNVTHGLGAGTIIWAFPSTMTSTDAMAVYEISTPFIGGLMLVTLTQTGGSNGSKTTAASWTYTVGDLGGVQLGTGMSPQVTRGNGTRSAATGGYGYFDASQTFRLLYAIEHPGTGGCA